MKELFTGEHGLFPSPSEISFNCSCSDWALMCKHVALENRVEKMLENAQKPSSRVIEGQVDITQLFGVL